jgi:hypothetical protein
LITSQEDASDHLSAGMSAFVRENVNNEEGMYSLYPPSAMAGSHRKSIMVLLEKLL